LDNVVDQVLVVVVISAVDVEIILVVEYIVVEYNIVVIVDDKMVW